MQKIPTVFKRNPDDMKHVTDEVNPECQWVLDGEGVATRKYDGTCVAYLEFEGSHGWYGRREVKADKPLPPMFVEVNHDEVTDKKVGWEPIINSPFYKFWMEAYMSPESKIVAEDGGLAVGTYELCGPKINGNPEGYESHVLIKHSDAEVLNWTINGSIDFGSLAHTVQYLGEEHGWEGLVWHHPDGRMAKLKVRDFA